MQMQFDLAIYKVFAKLAAELNKNSICYGFAGAIATTIYADPRATTDIDLIAVLDEKTRAKIINILSRTFQLVQSQNETLTVSFFEIWRNVVIDSSNKNQLIPGDFLESVMNRIFQFKVDDQIIRFISKEDLIILKLGSRRGKDIDDIERIISFGREVDFDYIDRWAARFSLPTGTINRFRQDRQPDIRPEI